MSPVTPFSNKRKNAQKLFGCISSQLSGLFSILSFITVKTKNGKRCKPKKNNGQDPVLQFWTAKLCGHKSVYHMNKTKTPKMLKRKGIFFLPKSTHYDTIASIDLNSVWTANAQLLKPFVSTSDYISLMLDGTPNPLESLEYEAHRKGYAGQKKGVPILELTEKGKQVVGEFKRKKR